MTDRYRDRGPRYRMPPPNPGERSNLAAERARVIAKQTENEVARRALLAQTGQKDHGQGRTDLDATARGTNADPGPSKTFTNAFGTDGNGTPTGNKSPAWNARFHNIGSPADAPQLQAQSSTGSGTVTRSMAAQGVGRPEPIEPGKTISGPGVDALMNWGANTDADKARAVAGTGNVAQTRFGTVSSRTAAPREGGENAMRPLVGDQSTGVKHAAPGDDWQQELIAKHPQIGVKDSPENKAFLAAYKSAHAAQGPNSDGTNTASTPVDHMALADQVMKDVKASQLGPPELVGPREPTPVDPTTAVASTAPDPAAAPPSFGYFAHNDMNSRGEPVPGPTPGFNSFAEKAGREAQAKRTAAAAQEEANTRSIQARDLTASQMNPPPPDAGIPRNTTNRLPGNPGWTPPNPGLTQAQKNNLAGNTPPIPASPTPSGIHLPDTASAQPAGLNGIGADPEEEKRKKLAAAGSGASFGDPSSYQ